jgi:Spy/CpxP family protein refolding chaperone
MKKSLWLTLFLLAPLHASAQDHSSPYAGQQGQEIKALSQDEVKGYMTGQGMGLAKAAELNGYPSPLRVLELAGELKLSDEQKQQVEEIRQVMLQEAKRLGPLIVENEKELDALFASGKITEGKLRTLVEEISRLQGELRTAHLQAYLDLKSILTEEQVKRYNQLRDYEAKKAGAQHKSH